jgi:hypothetical protein
MKNNLMAMGQKNMKLVSPTLDENEIAPDGINKIH